MRHLRTPWIAIPRPAAALLAALAIVLLAAASASALDTKKIFEECGNSQVPTGFSQQAYDQALKHMPAELAEYSECPYLIHKAQRLAAAGNGGGGSGGIGGGSPTAVAPPTAAEQRTLEHLTHSAAPPVKVGEEVIHPGVVHVDIASAVGNLPTPLLALLAFLLAGALLALGRVAFAHVRARRHEA